MIAFIMDVGLRAAEQEAYTLLRALCQLSVTQTMSFNVRPDKLQRSALANYMQQQIGSVSTWNEPLWDLCFFSGLGVPIRSPQTALIPQSDIKPVQPYLKPPINPPQEGSLFKISSYKSFMQ